jgi:thiol-disulfide isomerase/thioredoxin
MRFVALVGSIGFAAASNPASTFWTELKAKREALPSVHQEFEVTRTFKTSHGAQSSKRDLIIDSRRQWRERSISGSGNQIRIFDGKDLFRMEEGGDEYVRTKRKSKDEDWMPPYAANAIDSSKAKELSRRPCGIPGNDRVCVVLEMPRKGWTRPSSGGHFITLLQGIQRTVLDTETGLALGSLTVEMIDNARGGYQSETTYVLKRLSYGAAPNASLFQLPSNDLREVKELSNWNAARIKRQLAGKPAPDLIVTDLKGSPLTLSGFKGKTVLLDFWTTWCPPCRADAPAIHDLYRKYGEKELMIVSISVSEDREVVEKFLKEHPVDYSVVLTTENEMPRPYQVSAFPTYIIIDRDGTLAAAVEGDKGFFELRKLLKRAGLEPE